MRSLLESQPSTPNRVHPDPRPSLVRRLSARTTRTLYFDIDGTLVRPTFGDAQPVLAAGRFERAVRDAGFERLVCVSDAVTMCRLLVAGLPGPGDFATALFRFCRGTFQDEAWFRSRVTPVLDPMHRAEEIDLEEDWYYVDDHAHAYLKRAGIAGRVFEKRVLQCDPREQGHDVMAWLRGLAAKRPGAVRGGRASRRRRFYASCVSSLEPYSWRRA